MMTLLDSTSHARRARAALAVLALAAVLAACGGGASGDGGVVSLAQPSATAGASAAPSASLDPEEAMIAFTACMREHGIDIQVSIATAGEGGNGIGKVEVGSGGVDKGTDPQANTAPIDKQAAVAAQEACKHLLPRGGMGDPSATIPPEVLDSMLAFSACMREHGVDYPDPDVSGGGISIEIGGPDAAGGIDPSSEKFQAAQEACAAEMPEGPFKFDGGPMLESKP